MLAGMYRFVCANGLVCGDTSADFRMPHKGNIVESVIGGAYEVLDGFTRIVDERESMQALTLNDAETESPAAQAFEFGPPRGHLWTLLDMSERLGLRR